MDINFHTHCTCSDNTFIEHRIEKDKLTKVNNHMIRDVTTTKEKSLYDYLINYVFSDQRFIYYKFKSDIKIKGLTNEPICIRHLGDVSWVSHFIVSQLDFPHLDEIILEINGLIICTISVKLLEIYATEYENDSLVISLDFHCMDCMVVYLDLI